MWLFALVSLCSRRDIAIHRKLSWVVAVPVLNVVGAVIYFVAGPTCARPPSNPDDAIDPDAEPIQPPGQSWNPILGVNRAAAGEGLNQADEERLDKT